MDYSITKLNISNRGLTKLPDDIHLYTNLVELNCSDNKITSLDNLPLNLETVYCNDNQLTALDNLPLNLKLLYCYNNEITTLDNLPPNLKNLKCYSNKITSLDNLPITLKNLDCYSNKITSLYNLPPNINYIKCDLHIEIKHFKNSKICRLFKIYAHGEIFYNEDLVLCMKLLGLDDRLAYRN